MIHPTSTYLYVIDNCTFYDPPYYYLLVRHEKFTFFDPPYYYLLVVLGLGLGLRHFTFYDPPFYYLLVGLGLGLGLRHFTIYDPPYFYLLVRHWQLYLLWSTLLLPTGTSWKIYLLWSTLLLPTGSNRVRVRITTFYLLWSTLLLPIGRVRVRVRVTSFYLLKSTLLLTTGTSWTVLPSLFHPTTTYWYVMDNFTFFDPPTYYLLVGLWLR